MTDAVVQSVPTTVPIDGGSDVQIEPGQPWPAPYRGSTYSVVDSRKHSQTVLQWQYKDLKVQVNPPDQLLGQLQAVGKSGPTGKGSIRITAGSEVLTKVEASNYSRVEEAPISDGWIPVYLGKLDGDLGFDIAVDPDPPQQGPTVWSGFPFNHGERWTVSHDDRLLWKWQDYRFYSAFDHSELIETYQQFRSIAGRLYINEYGHVFANVPNSDNGHAQDEIARIFTDWKKRAEARNDSAAIRLVNRRLKVTGDGNIDDGLLPLCLGHLSQFDDSTVPRPVVTDDSYYVATARGESLGY
jgi:hypothetical protein